MPATLPVNMWYAGWVFNHATAGDMGFVKDWDLQADPTLQAQKKINASTAGPSVNLTERTMLTLKPSVQ